MSFAGIKLHQCLHKFTISDEGMKIISEFAMEKDIPIFIHLYNFKEARKLVELARKYPKTNFIIAHLMCFETIAKNGPDLKNIYFDISPYYIISEKRIKLALSKFGDDKDRVLKKTDGELTYFASDIAYHKDKLRRQFDMLINLWGPDHHGYIKRVKSSIKALGCKKDILTVIIIQLVSLKTKERMSKRKGTAILLADLIKDVGTDAARFYYLLRKNSSPLEFDIDLAKTASFDNPLYYIQYAYARIHSIFRKAEVNSFSLQGEFLEEEDLSLARDILQFAHCLDKAYYNLEPVFIVEYLKALAASFHKFYEKSRVLSDDKNVRAARLSLLEAVRVVIDCGLAILGITPLKKM